MQFYRPLQFFVILEASAFIASFLSKLHYFIKLEWVANICLGVGAITLAAWTYWFWLNQQALHCKFGLLAIAVGTMLGLWL